MSNTKWEMDREIIDEVNISTKNTPEENKRIEKRIREQAALSNSAHTYWICSCGAKNKGTFCTSCTEARPENVFYYKEDVKPSKTPNAPSSKITISKSQVYENGYRQTNNTPTPVVPVKPASTRDVTQNPDPDDEFSIKKSGVRISKSGITVSKSGVTTDYEPKNGIKTASPYAGNPALKRKPVENDDDEFSVKRNGIKISKSGITEKPVTVISSSYKKQHIPVTWICTCGAILHSNYCPDCGIKKPEGNVEVHIKPEMKWTCLCGQTCYSNFCPDCGRAVPYQVKKKNIEDDLKVSGMHTETQNLIQNEPNPESVKKIEPVKPVEAVSETKVEDTPDDVFNEEVTSENHVLEAEVVEEFKEESKKEELQINIPQISGLSSAEEKEPVIESSEDPSSDYAPKRDLFGYDEDGFNMFGYDKEGYDKEGFNRYGYNREGYDSHGYDKYGYDKDGYDQFGYDKNGNDRRGTYHFGLGSKK